MNMNIDYYYSVKFADEGLRFHGYFETAFKDLKTIKANARKSIAAKLPEWGFTGDDIEYFEIYTYENDDEKRVFEWRKEQTE